MRRQPQGRAWAARKHPATPMASGRRKLLAVALAGIVASACGRPGSTSAERRQDAPVVDSISDGDSFIARLPDGRRIGVRIAGIDAPEKDQPWADAARSYLTQALGRESLQIEPLKTDPFGRQVAVVRTGDEDVGLMLVRAGLAWHFVRYAADQSAEDRAAYALAEREARTARRGLWADPAPVAPWVHRQRQRGG